MSMSLYHRPLKQWYIVLWNGTLLKVNTRESHRKSIRAKKFALEEYFCSFVVHLLVLFHFLASNDAHPPVW